MSPSRDGCRLQECLGTHSGKPEASETVHQQIDKRIDAAAQFVQAHGTDQKRGA